MKLIELHVRFNARHVVLSLNLMVVVGEWGFFSHFTGEEGGPGKGSDLPTVMAG